MLLNLKMYLPVTAGILLLLTSPSMLHHADGSTGSVTWLLATPEDTYTNLCSDAATLLRRALAEPNDAKALALLQSEGARLAQRQQQLRPVFAQWYKALSPAQRQAVYQRMLNNNLIRYMQSLENNAKINARLERSPKLQAAVIKLTDVMQMGIRWHFEPGPLAILPMPNSVIKLVD